MPVSVILIDVTVSEPEFKESVNAAQLAGAEQPVVLAYCDVSPELSVVAFAPAVTPMVKVCDGAETYLIKENENGWYKLVVFEVAIAAPFGFDQLVTPEVFIDALSI